MALSETEKGVRAGAELPADETELLLHYLRTHDAVCPLCKYNLRNLTVPWCPECGRAIRMVVGLVEQRIAPLILLLTSILLPAGVGLLLWTVILSDGGPPDQFRFSNFHQAMEALTVIGFLICPFIAVPVFFLRRRFQRLSPRSQWCLAMVSLAVPMVLFGGWIVFRMR